MIGKILSYYYQIYNHNHNHNHNQMDYSTKLNREGVFGEFIDNSVYRDLFSKDLYEFILKNKKYTCLTNKGNDKLRNIIFGFIPQLMVHLNELNTIENTKVDIMRVIFVQFLNKEAGLEYEMPEIEFYKKGLKRIRTVGNSESLVDIFKNTIEKSFGEDVLTRFESFL